MLRDSQKSPSPQRWLQDFQAILALSPISAETTKNLVYSRYPDSGFAHEYWFSIWNAYCYLTKNRKEFENLGLTVIGNKKAILKDCLLIALYKPFLSCPLETMHLLDFPVAEIAASAHDIEKKFGG